MPPERTAQSYGPGVTTASKAVLLELMTVLRAYRDALVLVGGWAPYFLLEQARRAGDPFAHVGSIDIDLAVDPGQVGEAGYASMVELLTERGYRPAPDRRGAPIPTSLERVVSSPVTKKPYTIRVDFLTHRNAPGASPGQAQIQDGLFARKLKGCEAAFTHRTTLPLSGVLPDGGELTVPIQLADAAAMLTMKGIVLGERYREKDAYDLYALIGHYGPGPRAVAEVIRPWMHEPLVREAMANVRQAFGRREANGPAWVASFLVHPAMTAERERLLTDAFMVVNEFMQRLTDLDTVPPPVSPCSGRAGVA